MLLQQWMPIRFCIKMKKIILITGATSGIGKATAQLLASKKYQLIICGRNAEVLKKLNSELSESTKVLSLAFDVRDQLAVEKNLTSLPIEWKDIDVLINNAGNAHGLDPLTDGNFEDWDAMMDTNVKGLLYVSQPIIREMKSRGTGHIINISSVAGRQTYANGVVYCASKKAVDVISEGMRIELTAFGIKVTNIQPGAVETDFSKVRFKGDEARAAQVYSGFEALQPEDIAEAIAYCMEAPDRVSIGEMVIYPKAQAESRTIYRK